MPNYEIFRVEDGPEAHPFESIKSHYMEIIGGTYVFYELNKKWAPDLVLPVSRFWVAKVEE